MTVDVDLWGDEIRLTGGGRGTKTKAAAAGGRWRQAQGHWVFRAETGTCRALRAQFGDELRIGRDLNRWARKALALEARLHGLASQIDAELTNVPRTAPKMDAAMGSRSYQRVAAKWVAETGSCLIADQQGLGKSIETLASIIETAPETDATQWHLITAPSVAVESVWTAEVLRWLDANNARVRPLTGTLAEREEGLRVLLTEEHHEAHVFVVANLESARVKPHWKKGDPQTPKKAKYHVKDAVLPALFSIEWDTVIVDECQRALIRTSGVKGQTRAGFELLSKNCKRRIALSGTPMRGKPEQLWGTLHWLRPDVYTAYWSWVDRYFKRTGNGYSNYLIDGFQPGGEDRLAADLQTIMIRRTKAEVLPELPPKQYAGTYLDPTDESSPFGVWLDPLPGQLKQIHDFERDGMLDFGDEGEMMGNGSLAVYTRNKQLANGVHRLVNGVFTPTLESPKYEWLVRWLEEADGEKVIVSSQYTAVIDTWAAGLRDLGYSVAVLTGKTSRGARVQMVQSFQTTDEIQVFMLNAKAGGVALTLDAADYVVHLDESPVPDDQEQVEDRAHRTSRIHNVTVYALRVLGTQDEEIAWVAAARADVQQYLLDGARGVKAARALYDESKGK